MLHFAAAFSLLLGPYPLMDPWKPIRLWLAIAAIIAFLAVGGYARLRWGVPEAPYGYVHASAEPWPPPPPPGVGDVDQMGPLIMSWKRSANPFEELEFLYANPYGVRHYP